MTRRRRKPTTKKGYLNAKCDCGKEFVGWWGEGQWRGGSFGEVTQFNGVGLVRHTWDACYAPCRIERVA